MLLQKTISLKAILEIVFFLDVVQNFKLPTISLYLIKGL